MGICEIAVEFDESEMALIQAHANISNMSFSEFVRRAALEKVEDIVDIETFNEALMKDADAQLKAEKSTSPDAF